MSEDAAVAPSQTYFAFAGAPAKPGKTSRGGSRKPLPEPLPDILCGRYRVERLIGVGGMGAVYRGRDLLREQFGDPEPHIALKTLSDDFAEHPDANTLLHSEFALTFRLQQPNIIRFHTFEIDARSERAFIVMELLKGCTLDQLLLRYPQGLPWNKAREIALALLDGLAYAHRHGVLHGDLKPGNVMLADQGVRLFDFGLGQTNGDAIPSLPQLARDRFAAWTPRYAAPELIEGGSLTPATDIYAIACVIYEMCHGQHPYQRLSAKQAQGLKLIPTAPADMPAPVWKMLRQALEFDSSRRCPDADRLLAAFRSSGSTSRFSRWIGRSANS